jgi:sulfur carrier protein ThiS
MANVILKQLGKAAKSVEINDGDTINDLLDELSIDRSGKSFVVVGDGAPETKYGDYVLQDGDQLRISANNAAA